MILTILDYSIVEWCSNVTWNECHFVLSVSPTVHSQSTPTVSRAEIICFTSPLDILPSVESAAAHEQKKNFLSEGSTDSDRGYAALAVALIHLYPP
jgi:hypothetical protein